MQAEKPTGAPAPLSSRMEGLPHDDFGHHQQQCARRPAKPDGYGARFVRHAKPHQHRHLRRGGPTALHGRRRRLVQRDGLQRDGAAQRGMTAAGVKFGPLSASIPL